MLVCFKIAVSSGPKSWRSSSSDLNFTSGMLSIHSHCTHLKSTRTALFCFVSPFLWGSSNHFLISGPWRAILRSRRPACRFSMVFENFGTGLPYSFRSICSPLNRLYNTYNFHVSSKNLCSLHFADFACADSSLSPHHPSLLQLLLLVLDDYSLQAIFKMRALSAPPGA